MARTVLHILLGIALWAVFGWYWHLVMQQPVTPEAKRALLVVAIIVAGIWLFDVYWIFHNLRIARRGRRRNRRPEPALPATDFLGRTFMAQSDEVLRRARYIEVHVVEMADEQGSAGHKLFRVNERVPEE
jgi:hypothetical protein